MLVILVLPLQTLANSGETAANSGELWRTPARRTLANSGELWRTPANPGRANSGELWRTLANRPPGLTQIDPREAQTHTLGNSTTRSPKMENKERKWRGRWEKKKRENLAPPAFGPPPFEPPRCGAPPFGPQPLGP